MLRSRRIGEMSVGIICACMPTCAAAIRDKFPSRFHLSLKSIKCWLRRDSSDSASGQEIVAKVNSPSPESSLGGFHPHQEGYLELGSVARGPEKTHKSARMLARSCP